MERLLIIIVIAFILAIGIYIATAIFLNKFNRLVYGKGTALAWIPICNVYLLGKLTINKLVGWILVICVFLTGTYSTNINGVENTYTILPKNISSVASSLYELVTFALFVYAIIKYNKMKKSGSVNVQQPVQPASMPESTAPVQPAPMPQPAAPVQPAPMPESTAPVQPAPMPQPTAPVQSTPMPQPTAPVQSTPMPQPTAPVQPTPMSQQAAPMPQQTIQNQSNNF